ncbi:MAG: hypothetical protein JST75_11425 [Bacteroidetes bacterium]|nr:hypothetical protein [Bacteroidota bacterium]
MSFNRAGDSSHLNKNWFFTRYGGITTGFSFYKGGSATFLAAPIGLQLNRKINNNVYAFAGISGAPAFVNFNNAFINSSVNKSYPSILSTSNGFGMYSRAEIGLMYVNDARTFSISGSIGVERSSSPIYPSFASDRDNTKRK